MVNEGWHCVTEMSTLQGFQPWKCTASASASARYAFATTLESLKMEEYYTYCTSYRTVHQNQRYRYKASSVACRWFLPTITPSFIFLFCLLRLLVNTMPNMSETKKFDISLLEYGPAEPLSSAAPTSTSDDASSGSSITDSPTPTSPQALTKTSLRKLMVSCIDSALEELGPLSDVADELKIKPLPNLAMTSASSTSMPTAEELYGSSSSRPDPLRLRSPVRRPPRYQRRGSVTKFSLGNVLKQVQKEDTEGTSPLKPSPSRQLWERLYSKMDSRPLKRTALVFAPLPATTVATAAIAEGPATKRMRRRGCV